ncbi:MAG: 30S ribosomal protein S16 [Pirellulales bacterium]|nr:30S ribosomal protein S16 [Pirellulales bacterium]
MAVRIRMKKMGRTHRPFYRICAMDGRVPRDGRVLEELGTYDPFIPETDARVTMNTERVDYWIGVGAQPSDNVSVFIKKYGTNGTHREEQAAAQERLAVARAARQQAAAAVAPAEEAAAEPAPAEETPAAEAEAPAEEAVATEETKPAESES